LDAGVDAAELDGETGDSVISDAGHDVEASSDADQDEIDVETESDADVDPGPSGSFSFLQITDTHIGSYGDHESGMRYFVERITKEMDFPLPDFVLVTGDIANDGEPDQYADFTRHMSNLGVPFYPVPGNHHDGGYKSVGRGYLESIGPDRVNYSFDHKGIRFIMLARYNTDPDREWVEALIAESDLPVIICDHMPMHPVRTAGRATTYHMSASWLEALFERHPGKVVAFISGHTHVSSLVRRDGVHHINTQALATCPHSYRLFDVHDDRMEVRTFKLQDRPGERFWWGGLQWGLEDGVDDEHPTNLLYNFGNEEERELVVPLPER